MNKEARHIAKVRAQELPDDLEQSYYYPHGDGACPYCVDRAASAGDAEAQLEAMWEALKRQNCADPPTAGRIAMLSHEGFNRAMRPFTTGARAASAALHERGSV